MAETAEAIAGELQALGLELQSLLSNALQSLEELDPDQADELLSRRRPLYERVKALADTHPDIVAECAEIHAAAAVERQLVEAARVRRDGLAVEMANVRQRITVLKTYEGDERASEEA